MLHFGSKFLKDMVVRDCMEGNKVICLAITEPYAGSDVASIRTEAKKSPCGKVRRRRRHRKRFRGGRPWCAAPRSTTS